MFLTYHKSDQSVGKEMRSANSSGILLIIATLYGILILSPLVFPSINSVMIRNTGEIVNARASVTAKSGSAIDIQAAVDLVASTGGDVYIPEGTFNFVNVGEWSSSFGAPVVTVPAGVSVYGAPTQRDTSGQVISWNTVLVCPWDVPDQGSLGGPWFFFQGNGNPNKPSRFSDIRMEGYRYLNPSSTTQGPKGIILDEIMNFRIDHCYFRDVTGGAVWAGWYGPNTDNTGDYRTHTNGVIDHSLFINTNGIPGPTTSEATVGYGIHLARVHSTYWDSDILNVVGHYTTYTTFIEDCYFEKWRHCVTANDGYHFVFRYNTVNADFGFGSIDQHGTYNAVGTRAVEVYGNTFTNCLEGYNHEVSRQRGGAGVYFNNVVDGSYGLFVGTSKDGLTPTYALVGYIPDCPLYIWDNTLASGVTTNSFGSAIPLVEGENLFYSELSGYTPYIYPHPLTVDATP